MGEYISREALKDYVSSLSTHPLNEWDTMGVIMAIDHIPAADVVEVRHGRWLPSDTPDSILDKCSECGFNTGAFTFRYCPNCGAKMDGGQDE